MNLKIIQTPNYILGVDKTQRPEDRSICVSYHKETGKPMFDEHYYEEDEKLYVYPCDKIIAHIPLNDKPLEGVWLLPEIENWEELYQKNGIALQNERNKLLFRKGYKAAGGYTEEDMRKCWDAAVRKTISDSQSNDDNIPTKDEYIKFLKPFPIEFEVEMEWVNNGDDSHDEGGTLIGSVESYQQPKILNNIIQGKFIWKQLN